MKFKEGDKVIAIDGCKCPERGAYCVSPGESYVVESIHKLDLKVVGKEGFHDMDWFDLAVSEEDIEKAKQSLIKLLKDEQRASSVSRIPRH